jgi:hypothetical protein
VFDDAVHRKSSHFGLASFLKLFLIAAVAITLLFADGNRLRTVGSAVLRQAEQVVGKDSLSVTPARPAISSSINAAHTSPTASGVSQTSANTSQTAQSKNAPQISGGDAISIPAADVSLRNRPELLKQLVQIYRSQLIDDPNNSTARTAFNKLQEQSLAELQTIVLEGDEATAIKSLDVISRIFPEIADNARYKYLAVRTDRFARQIKDQPVAKSESSPTANPATTHVPEKSASSPEKNASPAINASTMGVKEGIENSSPAKPEIRALSMTAGTLVNDRFIPGDEGNFFMVEISYRNFSRVSENQDEALLVARLGIPGDPSVLAEVPVEILGDRGKKSFVIANMMPGNIGGKYRLNFILDGEFIASSTVRVSMPEQYSE